MGVRKRSPAPSDLPSEGRPQRQSNARTIWGICDTLYLSLGRVPSREEVKRAYEETGGDFESNFGRYHEWKRAKTLLDADHRLRSERGRAEPRVGEWLPVSESGEVVLPRQVLAAMRLDESRQVLVQVVEGEARLRSGPVALEHVQRIAGRYKIEGVSIVDELIADRRAEAARESEG